MPAGKVNQTLFFYMEKAEDWAQTDDVERALIVLASFNVWTLEEAAYLSAGLLPPGYKEQQDMLVKRLMAEKTLRELESAIKRVEGRLSLMFCGTGGLNVEIQAVDDKGRFKAADLVEFLCHMYSKRSMQTLLSYRKRGLEANALEEIREYEFSQRPREAPGERKAGLLLSNGNSWVTEDLALMGEAAEELWEPAYRGERGIPTAAQVEAFLIGKKVTQKKAKVMASILRPEDLPTRVSRNYRVTQ